MTTATEIMKRRYAITTEEIAEARQENMELDVHKFKPDERFSNHAVQGFSHPDCPLDKGCFGIATGFGGKFSPMCEFFENTDETANCKYKDRV